MGEENEARLKAKLDRADARIAELEAQLKTAQIQAQIFANAMANGAVRVGLVGETQTNGLNGLQLIELFDEIVNAALPQEELLKKLEADFEKLAETHLVAHKAATTVEMSEWHRGMWEAYQHAAGHLSRRGENSGV